ncbi:M10 family metallopeptidase [Hansschlegelia sp. KR7-227]|uniref:M10 family metallopeptidase n=1 Tax=Hansschlegelia sp. KR7-227 TaxID=3400914 RepID=UPI003BFCBF13
MSSIGDEDIDDTGATGDAKIDGLLGQYHWSLYGQNVMRYSITDSYDDYEDSREALIDDYPDSNAEDVFAMPANMVRGIADAAAEFRNILTFRFDIDQNAQQGSRIRYGITDFSNEDTDAPAYAYMPDDEDGITDIDIQNWMSGDVFFNEDKFTAANPVVGSYAYHTILHETGHAMGLKHGHESEEFDNDFVRAALPREWDSMEFSVMTYRSYVGDDVKGGYSNPAGHYAQTLMMLDIAALQSMYGADFTSQSRATTYSWDPTDGSYSINGVKQWTPLDDVVFMTIWDGGGQDTYDFATYGSNIDVDLAPGGFVDLNAQIAQLEVVKGVVTQAARGNVFNALQYQDDLRSLIENATTGSGNDTLGGNVANNALDSGRGNDVLRGGVGDDTLTGGAGSDTISGGTGVDYAAYTDKTGVSVTIARIGAAAVGAWDVTGFAEGGGDQLTGVEGFIFGEGADNVQVRGAPAIYLNGQDGNDTLNGGDGAVTLVGGRGTDALVVGDGVFTVYGGLVTPAGNSVGARSQNDRLVLDRSGDDDGYFFGSDLPDKFARFYDFEGSSAEGIARIQFTGGDGDDALYGAIGADTLAGGRGRDLLESYAGDDVVRGGGDVDTIRLGLGNDTAFGDESDDYLDGEEGDDVLWGGIGSDLLYGGEGNDEIHTGRGDDLGVDGEAGNDTLIGDVDDENLTGGTGHDSLVGADGADYLQGGAGDDTLDGGNGADVLLAGGGRVVAIGGAGFDKLAIDRSGESKGLSFFVNGAKGSDGSSSSGIEELDYFGGSGADTVTAGAGSDDIHGGRGADVLNGGAGRNFLYGDAGADVLTAGSGRDQFEGGEGADRFVFRGDFGDDVIADFDAAPAGGQDRIDLRSFDFASFADFRSEVTLAGASTATLTFGRDGPTLTLSGVGVSALGAADFLF